MGTRLALLLLLSGSLSAETRPRAWALAANSRFEIYSQAGPESAASALEWFERLRAWLSRETGLQPDRLRPARVIGFASAAEYLPYRLHANANAYYVGTEGRDYIVMTLAGPDEFGIAAHEYAHMALHTAGLRLPPCLGEGLAEVFATVRMDARSTRLGGDRPAHSRLLRSGAWLPLARLWSAAPSEQTELFYAESWALAGMLALSPEYRYRFRSLVLALGSGMAVEDALRGVLGKSASELESDLRAWVAGRRYLATVEFPAALPDPAPVSPSAVSPVLARRLLATLLLDAGEYARAASLYRELAVELPADGDVEAGLGLLALYDMRRDSARQHWRRALQSGVADDALCYRYAMLADQAGIDPGEIRPVLERALALRPAFEDARFRLALLEKNAGHADVAIARFQEMREVPAARAFAYWSALSDALDAAGRHDEAEAAAEKAGAHASNAAERARAAELAWFSRTEPAARMTPNGAVMTRIPRRGADWNPFVQPADVVRRAEGLLREIDCGTAANVFAVETATGLVRLAIPDPHRVLMRNAPDEFTCGPQPGNPVTVVYAASAQAGVDGTARGIEFR